MSELPDDFWDDDNPVLKMPGPKRVAQFEMHALGTTDKIARLEREIAELQQRITELEAAALASDVRYVDTLRDLWHHPEFPRDLFRWVGDNLEAWSE